MMCPSVVDMKKVLLAVSVMVVISAFLVSCSQGSLVDNKPAESETEQETTTTIVDEEGTTHYYKIVSDDSQGLDSTTVLAEIATDKNGEPITNHSGEYVTTESTTVITTETTTAADDNDISFDNEDKPTTAVKTDSTTSEHVSEAETTPPESPTDSEGWIDRWY